MPRITFSERFISNLSVRQGCCRDLNHTAKISEIGCMPLPWEHSVAETANIYYTDWWAECRCKAAAFALADSNTHTMKVHTKAHEGREGCCRAGRTVSKAGSAARPARVSPACRSRVSCRADLPSEHEKGQFANRQPAYHQQTYIEVLG